MTYYLLAFSRKRSASLRYSSAPRIKRRKTHDTQKEWERMEEPAPPAAVHHLAADGANQRPEENEVIRQDVLDPTPMQDNSSLRHSSAPRVKRRKTHDTQKEWERMEEPAPPAAVHHLAADGANQRPEENEVIRQDVLDPTPMQDDSKKRKSTDDPMLDGPNNAKRIMETQDTPLATSGCPSNDEAGHDKGHDDQRVHNDATTTGDKKMNSNEETGSVNVANGSQGGASGPAQRVHWWDFRPKRVAQLSRDRSFDPDRHDYLLFKKPEETGQFKRRTYPDHDAILKNRATIEQEMERLKADMARKAAVTENLQKNSSFFKEMIDKVKHERHATESHMHSLLRK